MTQYMVIETISQGCKVRVYDRFHAKGRMLPDGLHYLDSWLEKDGDRCFQLMETDDRALFDAWIENWNDLVSFEVIEIGEKPKSGGQIKFTSPKGIVATAPAQIIGDYNSADGTWLWAWDNPSIDPKLAAHSKIVREYGEKNGIEELTSPKLSVNEKKCWEFAALACKLGKNQGVYRGPDGDTKVFITFGEVAMKKAKK